MNRRSVLTAAALLGAGVLAGAAGTCQLVADSPLPPHVRRDLDALLDRGCVFVAMGADDVGTYAEFTCPGEPPPGTARQ